MRCHSFFLQKTRPGKTGEGRIGFWHVFLQREFGGWRSVRTDFPRSLARPTFPEEGGGGEVIQDSNTVAATQNAATLRGAFPGGVGPFSVSRALSVVRKDWGDTLQTASTPSHRWLRFSTDQHQSVIIDEHPFHEIQNAPQKLSQIQS